MTVDKNVWHLVQESDKPRIHCADLDCDKQAHACEHAEFNVNGKGGISFHYYCEEHALEHGFKGIDSHPDINAINSVKDCNLLLRMGYNALDSIKPEFKPELQDRLRAIEDRKRRLLATKRQVAATRRAR